jgi:hypothetical protein
LLQRRVCELSVPFRKHRRFRPAEFYTEELAMSVFGRKPKDALVFWQNGSASPPAESIEALPSAVGGAWFTLLLPLNA